MNASVVKPPPVPIAERRNQAVAHKVADETYRYRCCVICGLQTYLQVAHLDQNAGNNQADNLAYLCPTHHVMFDGGLYPVAGLRQLREHCQVTQGKLDHRARMKDAGKKAATTRANNVAALKRSASASKAVATRRARLAPREFRGNTLATDHGQQETRVARQPVQLGDNQHGPPGKVELRTTAPTCFREHGHALDRVQKLTRWR